RHTRCYRDWSSDVCSSDLLKAKTAVFKQRVADGEELDSVMPEAFAVVREAGKRTLQMRHFDMQLVGGIALHNGKIAEMRTGEGRSEERRGGKERRRRWCAR